MKLKYRNILIILVFFIIVYEGLTGNMLRYFLSWSSARSWEYKIECCSALKSLSPNIKDEIFKHGALFHKREISVFENGQFVRLINQNEYKNFSDKLSRLSNDYIFIKYYEYNSELFVILLSSYTERVFILREDGSIHFRRFNRNINNREFGDKIYTLATCNNFLEFSDLIRKYENDALDPVVNN